MNLDGGVAHIKERRQSRSWRINLPPASDLLQKERDNDEERVENPNAHGSGSVRQRSAGHERVAYLHDNQSNPKTDDGSFASCRHGIACQIKDNSSGEQSDFQSEFQAAIIPQTKANFPCVVVDREISRMRNEVENPVRKNSHGHDQSG